MVSPKRRPQRYMFPCTYAWNERCSRTYVRNGRKEHREREEGIPHASGESTSVRDDSIVRGVESRPRGRERSRACVNSLLAEGTLEHPRMTTKGRDEMKKKKKVLVVGVHGISLLRIETCGFFETNIEAEQNVRMSGVYRVW